MRKVKNAFLILLALLLTAAGGLLPMAAAQLQDQATANVAQYEDIEALRLKLEEEQPDMGVCEKLRLMMHGAGSEVTSEMTAMTGAEVLETMYAQLQPFGDMGVLARDISNDYLEYSPVMCYEDTLPAVYNYYWEVSMSLDVSQYDSVRAVLDDETGKLLAIEVIDPNLEIPEKALQELEYSISEYYFANLGLTPIDATQMETTGKLEGYNEGILADGGPYFLMSYLCVDESGGEINIEIGVDTHGFYIFPV